MGPTHAPLTSCCGVFILEPNVSEGEQSGRDALRLPSPQTGRITVSTRAFGPNLVRRRWHRTHRRIPCFLRLCSSTHRRAGATAARIAAHPRSVQGCERAIESALTAARDGRAGERTTLDVGPLRCDHRPPPVLEGGRRLPGLGRLRARQRDTGPAHWPDEISAIMRRDRTVVGFETVYTVGRTQSCDHTCHDFQILL